MKLISDLSEIKVVPIDPVFTNWVNFKKYPSVLQRTSIFFSLQFNNYNFLALITLFLLVGYVPS